MAEHSIVWDSKSIAAHKLWLMLANSETTHDDLLDLVDMLYELGRDDGRERTVEITFIGESMK